MTRNQQLIFAQPPKEHPIPGTTTQLKDSDIDLEGVALDGGVLLKTLYISLDPYMRGRMRPAHIKSYVPAFEQGAPLTNYAVGEVVRSENDEYKKGEHVYYMGKFEEYTVVKDMKLVGPRKLDAIKKEHQNVPWSAFIGCCGMPGKTAYTGLELIGKPKKGEAIFISSAAGAVGSLVGQLAKAKGLFVIGSAGSDDKVAFLKELGFDEAFNYKTNKIDDELKRIGRPIDINWENVGADTLDTLLLHMNTFGRIILCGLAATYNGEQYAYKNVSQLLVKRVHMQGFIVSDHHSEYEESFYKEIPGLFSSGQFKLKEDVAEGLNNAEDAFNRLLTGKNTGKAVVKIASE